MFSKDNNEDEYLMLSGIQHFKFCKRQWALIHIEQQWAENVKTIEGKHLHEKADQPFIREKRKNKLIVRGMPVQSRMLKINGICDVVEFIQDENGVEIVGEQGKYIPVPVEYKRGKPKRDETDIVQLAAQAICLEEMLVCEVRTGYMFYHEIKQRVEVPITDELKEQVRLLVSEMQLYYERKHTPRVKTGKHCLSCSLQPICLPHMMERQTVKSYIERMLKE